MVKIKYELTYQQDDIPVRGNAVASGDDAFDKATEDRILADLDLGNDYAWALVKVTASVEDMGQRFVGTAYLGACSYESDAELRKSVVEEYDLEREARNDLFNHLRTEVKRGSVAEGLLMIFGEVKP